MIQAKKFYATLPHKLNAAEEEYFDAIKELPDEDWTWEFSEEKEGETPLGGEMRLTFKPGKDTTK